MKSLYLIKPYLIENRNKIIFGIICLIIVDGLLLYIPRIVKNAIDDLSSIPTNEPQLLSYAFYIAGSAVLIGIFRYLWRICLLGASRRVEEGLRNRLFQHIQTLSSSYFNKTKTGDIMAHATNDINHIRMATGMGIVALTDVIVLGTAAIGFMSYINIKLTLLALVPMPMIVVISRIVSKRMHHHYQEVQKTYADLTEAVRERFAGIRIIKAYNMENNISQGLKLISTKYIGKNIALVKITAVLFPSMVLLTNISLTALLFFGGTLTITTEITTGDYVAFINYLALITWPMMAIGWVMNLIQRGRASLDRIDKIIKTVPEISNTAVSKSIGQIRGEIVFQDVGFSYNSGGIPVLSNINFTIKANTIIGIVGPPGSGKTTIANLIPRLYDIKQGHIFFDGVDIREIKIESLRSNIAFMPQEPFLFAKSIRDNITFNNEQYEEAQLVKGARKASFQDTVDSFPNGYETIVGEKGVILSGGQKQRIALARSLMLNKQILILDDPISQVDTRTAAHIIKTIKQMSGKKTIIIVSHRLAIVQFAHQIIVLKEGKITGSGTHDELLKTSQYYANTYRAQSILEEDLRN